MSNLYVTEPPTQGKILLSTSHGDIEVELWARETPKACRNVIGLALEGYYDDMLWHRIVPGFCIQTGDPTGTGTGGEQVEGARKMRTVVMTDHRRSAHAQANPSMASHSRMSPISASNSTAEAS